MSTTAAAHHILLLGGHGKIALLLTKKLVQRGWDVTSVIRNKDQEGEILKAGGGEGKVNVLVESLDDVKSVGDAERILGRVRPDWVVWSAGAGGKGGVSRTYAIDRDACTHFIRASVSTPSITKFLLVSAIASRSTPAPWWSEKDISIYRNQLEKGLPDYYKAKIASDEVLSVLGEERRLKEVKEGEKEGFGWIDLRPGTLSGEVETGRVKMGKIGVEGSVSRGDVAEVAVRLLEKPNAKGWFDLLGTDANTSPQEEVNRVLAEGIDTFEGESLEEIKKRVDA